MRKQLKNPNGYGSVIKLSGRRRRPYAVRVTDGFIEGKQIYRYISYHETKTEALKALAMEQVNPTLPKANITLEEIYKEWQQTKAYTNIAKSSQINYNAGYGYISALGNCKFADLRTANYQKELDKLNLANNTKRKSIILLNRLYAYAMEQDVVSKNYASFIKLDREAKREKRVFTNEEIERLWEHVDDIECTDTILIMIYTGMRISELLQLSKSNIDFDKNIISGNGIKTDAGKNRVIPIYPRLIPILKKYYDKNKVYILETSEGTCYSYNLYYSKFVQVCKDLKITGVTPHSCRHTFASLMAEAGVDTIALQKIIGHADYSTTANIYTHLDYNYLNEQINKI